MENNNSAPNTASKKNLIISGVVILVVVVALFLAPKFQNKNTDEEVEQKSEEVAPVTETPKALSRAEATAKYVGNIVRFSVSEAGECTVSPESLSAAQNTTIMIDNDTDIRRAITIGAKSYSVGEHRYTLSWLNTGAGELKVTCDGKDVGKVVVQ